MRLVEANTVDAYYDITKKETYEVSHNELQWRCKIHLQQLSTGLEPNEPAHQSWQVSKTPIVNGIQVSSVEGRVGMRVIKLRRKQIYPCVVADEGDLRLMNDPARLVIPPSLPGHSHKLLDPRILVERRSSERARYVCKRRQTARRQALETLHRDSGRVGHELKQLRLPPSLG